MHLKQDLISRYSKTRQKTLDLCSPLEIEDYSSQPVEFVSPPKWHLAHTTWFFESFILEKHVENYKAFDPLFSFLFNSYYNNKGARVERHRRGNCTRPTVQHVIAYRKHVDEAIEKLLSSEVSSEISELMILGMNHEEQHQELLVYDIKYILGHQPSFPKYWMEKPVVRKSNPGEFISIKEGLYNIGYNGDEFYFDHEKSHHQSYLYPFAIAKNLITNGEYIEFIEDGGYDQFDHWLDEGYAYIKNNEIALPLYWTKIEDEYYAYKLSGLKEVDRNEPVMHISFYEAAAFASWKGHRLPTEFEWEVAAAQLSWGELWEWTSSAFLPYPKYRKSEGAIGEYNGKFMVNQKVLRGASFGTPPGHSRKSYRNFFHPNLRWMLSGIRLVKDE